MSEGNQQRQAQPQQQAQPQRQQQQQQPQQQQQQQQLSPTQRLGRALADIRRVQNLMELNYPGEDQAILLLREAGDLVWTEIRRMQQAQQQQGS